MVQQPRILLTILRKIPIQSPLLKEIQILVFVIVVVEGEFGRDRYREPFREPATGVEALAFEYLVCWAPAVHGTTRTHCPSPSTLIRTHQLKWVLNSTYRLRDSCYLNGCTRNGVPISKWIRYSYSISIKWLLICLYTLISFL